LEGLEATEVNLSQLENKKTLGSEYYSAEFKKHSELIFKKEKNVKLINCCSLITDGDHGVADYVKENGVTFILTEAIKQGYVDINACRSISHKHALALKKSALEKNDVVLIKTGNLGASAVVTDEFIGANIIAHVGLLRPEKEINSYFLSTFLNCKYGISQILRRGEKTTRPEIKLVEIKDISIPLLKFPFQNWIEKIVKRGVVMLSKSNSLYGQAESLLLDTLGLRDFKPSTENINIKSFKESFLTTGRLDAEFYQKNMKK
jgi:type I restriction enzyme S subunit